MTNNVRAIRQKIVRLQAGGKPRVLDLFAGCGGISLGFSAAGFAIAGAVEFDPEAAASHGRNFHGGDAAHSKARDITKTSPCPRRPNFDPPCRLNFDPGMEAGSA